MVSDKEQCDGRSCCQRSCKTNGKIINTNVKDERTRDFIVRGAKVIEKSIASNNYARHRMDASRAMAVSLSVV